MKIAVVEFTGTSPYSQSKHHAVPKKSGEANDAYEDRTWRHRMHTDAAGNIVVPGVQFTNAIMNAARRRSDRVAGKGKATWTKHFEAGITSLNDIVLPLHVDNVTQETLFVPSDGKVGSGSRVTKHFGKIENWNGRIKFMIFDDTITREIFEMTVKTAGVSVGVGRWRPEKRGSNGRFAARVVEWFEGDEVEQGMSAAAE